MDSAATMYSANVINPFFKKRQIKVALERLYVVLACGSCLFFIFISCKHFWVNKQQPCFVAKSFKLFFLLLSIQNATGSKDTYTCSLCIENTSEHSASAGVFNNRDQKKVSREIVRHASTMEHHLLNQDNNYNKYSNNRYKSIIWTMDAILPENIPLNKWRRCCYRIHRISILNVTY